MSAATMQAVMASSIKPTGVRLVALCLAWHCNDATGEAWPGRALLAREAGLSHERVKKVLQTLERAGVIEAVVRGGSVGGRKWVTRYRFTAAWLGLHTTPVAGNPGSTRRKTGVAGDPRPGLPAATRKDEKKKPSAFSLSSKARVADLSLDAAPRRRRASAKPAAPLDCSETDYMAGIEE